MTRACSDRKLAAYTEGVSLSIKGRPLHTLAPHPNPTENGHDLPAIFQGRQPSSMEHKFTSTGIKFWKHRENGSDAAYSRQSVRNRSIWAGVVASSTRMDIAP